MSSDEVKRIAINSAAYAKVFEFATRPVLSMFHYDPITLTPKEKKIRKRREKKRLKAQKAHDKAVKNGAYCDSDY